MTDPEATQQNPEPDPDSSTDEAAANIAEAGEEGVAADYETRLREFDDVDSVPIASVPVQSSELDQSDLTVQSPGGESG